MKVELVTNPANDGAFRAAAERLMGDDRSGPEGLQSGLVGEFPRVSVVRGIQDRGTERWYAYRDGHWVNGSPDGRRVSHISARQP